MLSNVFDIVMLSILFIVCKVIFVSSNNLKSAGSYLLPKPRNGFIRINALFPMIIDSLWRMIYALN